MLRLNAKNMMYSNSKAYSSTVFGVSVIGALPSVLSDDSVKTLSYTRLESGAAAFLSCVTVSELTVSDVSPADIDTLTKIDE